MNLSNLISVLQSSTFGALNSPIKLVWGRQNALLANVLLPQRIDIREGMFEGIEGKITCLSTRIDLPLTGFLGAPLGVQLVTDKGALHQICGIVTDAQSGESDGSLATYQLTLRDALSVMDLRTNMRVFRSKSVPDIVETLCNEWRRRSTTLAAAFDADLSKIDRSRYPSREFTQQINESDAAFIRRLCRREGISWFIAAGAKASSASSGTGPVHTLVLFDFNGALPDSQAGQVRFHRDSGIEKGDAVTRWSASRHLIPGTVRRATWDYKAARMSSIEQPTSIDQGPAGNDLAQLLVDNFIDVPHAADSYADLKQQSDRRMGAFEYEGLSYAGHSTVRDFAVGSSFTLVGHPEFSSASLAQRQFITTSLHHRGENNLPKELNEIAQTLFSSSGWALASVSNAASSTKTLTGDNGSTVQTRYENTFTCVQRDQPIRPWYDPRVHLPKVYPMTGIVVGPEGEEVHCDAMGRIKVQFQGMRGEDHDHAQGAGTSGTDADSAYVRVAGALAGRRFGSNLLPRVGSEVVIDCLNGDPDKMYIAGILHNGVNPPAAFTHTGSLPGNRYVSGTKTKEIKGQRYNQLRFDDTPAQISTQLASEHAHSQLNMGYLTHPRDNGQGDARGEGAELRSDASVAIRSGQAMLISAWQRIQAKDAHLARDEYVQLMQECVDLFKSLGDLAAQNQGVAMDTQPQSDLAATIKSWPTGASATTSSSDAATMAAIGVSAPAGISLATPKTVATYAGGNIDTVAANHLQYTSGQRINMQAGHGVAMFAHQDGISGIANQGKVLLQSQADDTRVESAKNIFLSAADGKVSAMARDQVVFVTSGGAYLKLHGGDIELGCPGSFTVKSASHTWGDAASMSTDMPHFGSAMLGRVPTLVRATDGQAATGFTAEVTKASGEVVQNQTSETGQLSPISNNQFEQLAVKYFKKST
ncbi:type VI secretion system Vgr family protein [Robbsia andropogonis]|uniref:type VI secretion system Vgr family protein n=1 Tax=Robbsia andropogonis TaxID=28092 RepID=UPI00209E3B16|nr:type VI secretion system Vgr family protein [Robbsia andropogonis]MCP1121263.1 type VI secretion system tip protein VgrG [Robbsia andropogonis]MCP1131056.1 type VI secretion system tip protein VgrG [Robbsia andropogonis]